MRELTENQIFFLLERFFKHNTTAVGWKGIAEKLIKHGTCIVAGDTCIWRGGIGNFITVSDEPECEGCVRYTFDLNDFTKSASYKETLEWHLNTMRELIQDTELKLQEISVI